MIAFLVGFLIGVLAAAGVGGANPDELRSSYLAVKSVLVRIVAYIRDLEARYARHR